MRRGAELPSEQIELFSGVHLRVALGLNDGDRVTISVLPTTP